MKVCMITSVYALSDSDRNAPFLTEAIDQLVRKGHEVHIFAPSYEGMKSHVVHSVPVHRFRYFFKRWENLTHGSGAPTKIRNPLYILISMFYIISGLFNSVMFCKKHNFDLIHVHWPFPHGIWGYAASKISKTPMVLTFYGAELLLMRKFFFVKYFLKHAIKHAKEVICISRFTASEVANLTGKSLNIIPYGTTVNHKVVEKNNSKKTKDILFVGRLIARKGTDYLIKALPIIDSKVDSHLHIVGGGSKDAEWKRLVDDLGLNNKITFHGHVPNKELERLYAEADVFVLPSIVDDRGDTEGLGVVLIEAMCYGTPVVASNVGGIPDVIIDKKTGLLVNERDPEALSEAIVKILTDHDMASKLASEAIKHASEYFSWDRITTMVEGVYDKVATDSSK